MGAAAAGLVIGSLPYVLDHGQGQEGNSSNNLLKTVAPLVGAGVASLPFALDRQRGTPVAPTLSSPTIKNGWLVPNAYLRYHLYDQQGKLIDTRVQTIDKHAKDAWQRLSLHHEQPRTGTYP